MAATITETAAFGATTTAPSDGDAETAASVTAAGVGFQELANRTRWMKGALDPFVPAALEVFCNIDSGSLKFGTTAFAALLANGAAASGTTSNPGATGLTASTWYYLYAYVTGSAVALELATTAPDATRTIKSGDATRAFLASARTDGSGNVIPFRKSGRLVRYRWSGVASGSLQALAGFNTVGYTDVALAAFVPPHARVALLRGIVTTGATIDDGYLRTKGDTAGVELIGGANLASVTRSRDLALETDSAQRIQAQVTNVATSINLFVTGFQE